jgi:hypothetical protein
MSRNKKTELDMDLYEGMSEEDLKDAIIRNLRQKLQATVDLKAFRDSCNAVIAEMDSRNELALEQLAQIRGDLPIMPKMVNG